MDFWLALGTAIAVWLLLHPLRIGPTLFRRVSEKGYEYIYILRDTDLFACGQPISTNQPVSVCVEKPLTCNCLLHILFKR